MKEFLVENKNKKLSVVDCLKPLLMSTLENLEKPVY